MPLFVWSIYATSVIQVLATPVLGHDAAARGGRARLRLGHLRSGARRRPGALPALLLVLLAPGRLHHGAAGHGGDLRGGLRLLRARTSSATRRSPTPRSASPSSASSPGATTSSRPGSRRSTRGIFGVLSMFVGIFTAIKVFNWTATLYKGSISFKTPFAYFIGFLFFLVFGGMTGIALATVSLDVHWQDTYFVVAHFHFIMVGATMMAFLAALHYWFPKMIGRMYPEGWGLVARGAGHPRLQLHVHPAVPARQRGDAAALLLLPGALLGAQRGLHRRRLGARLRVPHHPRLPRSSR